MRYFDLSQPVYDAAPNCPAHPPVRITRIADHPGDGWRMELLHFAAHTGTHLDAPLHKLAGGKSIDQFPLETFAGPAQCVDVSDLGPEAPITASRLAAALGDSPIAAGFVLLHTGWGRKRAATDEWHHRSPFLHPDGAQWLVERGIRGVGIDHFSIGGTRDPDNVRTHEILLGAEILVIEDLFFRDGWREAAVGASFQALPLLLPGFSGSPCRAVLVQSS